MKQPQHPLKTTKLSDRALRVASRFLLLLMVLCTLMAAFVGFHIVTAHAAYAAEPEVVHLCTKPRGSVYLANMESGVPVCKRGHTLRTLNTVGPQGDIGPIGPQGIPGDTGAMGPQGPTGLQGEKGDQGIQGEVGPVGATGPQGEQGVTGAQGPRGFDGVAGATGAKGDPGRNGPSPRLVDGNGQDLGYLVNYTLGTSYYWYLVVSPLNGLLATYGLNYSTSIFAYDSEWNYMYYAGPGCTGAAHRRIEYGRLDLHSVMSNVNVNRHFVYEGARAVELTSRSWYEAGKCTTFSGVETHVSYPLTDVPAPYLTLPIYPPSIVMQ